MDKVDEARLKKIAAQRAVAALAPEDALVALRAPSKRTVQFFMHNIPDDGQVILEEADAVMGVEMIDGRWVAIVMRECAVDPDA